MRVVLPSLSVGLSLGIAYVYNYTGIHILELLLVAAAIVCIISLSTGHTGKEVKLNIQAKAGMLALSIGMLFGIILAERDGKINIYKDTYYSSPEEQIVSTGTFRIISDISYSDNYQKFVVEPLPKHRSNENILVTTTLANNYEYADVVSLKGALKTGRVILPDPSVSTRSFDYGEYLYIRNIKYTFNYGSVTKVGSASSSYDIAKRYLYRIKWALVHNLEKSMQSPESGLASGILLGVDGLMGKQVESDMKSVGLSHITVLSGYNLIIIVSGVFYILKYLPWKVRVIVSALIVTAFAIMVSGGSSLWRALLMTYISMLGLIGYRSISPKVAIWYAYIFIIVISPMSLMSDVSLHLSILATLGLIYITAPITTGLIKFKLLKDREVLAEIIAASLAVYLTTAPYIAYQFSNANGLSFIYNLIVAPIVPAIMCLSFIVSLAYYISPLLSVAIGYVDYLLLHFVIRISSFGGRSDVVSDFAVKGYSDVSGISIVILYIAYVLIYLLWLALMKRR